MARDPFSVLIKVRKLARDEAQRRLVKALTLEDEAERDAHRVELSIAQETEAATDLDGTDAMVEAFAAWLPEARRQLAVAQQILQDRQAATVRTRAELTACRTALETVETLQSQRRDETKRAIDLLYQHDLDDRAALPLDLTERGDREH